MHTNWLVVGIRRLADCVKEHPAIVLRREKQGTSCMDSTVAKTDQFEPNPQLRNQIKIETRAAKSRDLSLRSDDHMRVFNCVIEIVPGHGHRSKLALPHWEFKSESGYRSRGRQAEL